MLWRSFCALLFSLLSRRSFRGDDGFLFCASFELARERRCKGNRSYRVWNVTERGNSYKKKFIRVSEKGKWLR